MNTVDRGRHANLVDGLWTTVYDFPFSTSDVPDGPIVTKATNLRPAYDEWLVRGVGEYGAIAKSGKSLAFVATSCAAYRDIKRNGLTARPAPVVGSDSVAIPN